jgi:hypothetical protein
MNIFYILLAVAVGWFIGFLDSNLRTAKKIQAAEASAEIKIEEAERKIAQARQNLTSASPAQDDPGVLRLKKNGARFTLEMDGTPVTGQLSPDRKKHLAELITVIRPWLESGQSPTDASQPEAPAQTAPGPDPVQEAVSRPVQSAPQPLSAAKKPEAEKNISAMSIVQQVDTVLQARLMNTPLAKQGIRLQESIQGGVEVYVGLNKYNAVDDVPDEAIKDAIRAAIAEWEKKYTPGL